jgi:hypothetical protein
LNEKSPSGLTIGRGSATSRGNDFQADREEGWCGLA